MIRKIGWGAVLMLSIIMYSCYPKGAETINDTNLVATNYDDNFDFTSEKTYFLYGEVIYPDTEATQSPGTNAIILDEIKKQFTALGYTRVDSIVHPSDVNMVVMASVLVATVQGVSYYPGYGGWYGGYWGGWGYPGYGYGGGYYPVPYSYDLGNIFIDSFDSNLDPDSDLMPPMVWSASLNGVLSSTGNTSESRIRTLIDQAFVQSPYLK